MKYATMIHTRAIAYVAAAGLALTACDDFLDRPNEDSYNVDNFYQNDAQLYQAVNPIYNSPWYDFQRGFFKVGEVMSGNFYWGSSPYLTLTVNGTDEDLVNMSASLWSVNAHVNTLIKNINEKAGAGCTEAAKNAVKGEALTLKALAYFYLVRSFGGVPIVHDNTGAIADNSYNSLRCAKPENVYQYIVKTLEKAIEWLPESAEKGRIDRYCAKGLLAKVYLAKAGVSGTLDNADLAKAVELAKDVKDNSGRELMANFSDIFRLANNECDESLIAWRWTADGSNWTRQNTLQSDLAPQGFDETGANWGGWNGPSVDLIRAFGEDPLSQTRQNVDARRKATLMMAGDFYEYFWTDHTSTFKNSQGFEICDFYFNTNADILAARNKKGGTSSSFESPTGAQEVKHLVGDNADHVAGIGHGLQRMAYSNATHILRLADVYLILAEAQSLIDGGTTTNADALDAFNKVHWRSVPGATEATSLTWEQIWKERRLELACEGDRWYDFVRLAYYNKERADEELMNQERGFYSGHSDAYKTWFNSDYSTWDMSEVTFNSSKLAARPTYTMPFPDTDLAMNPGLSDEPIEVDINQYNY